MVGVQTGVRVAPSLHPPLPGPRRPAGARPRCTTCPWAAGTPRPAREGWRPRKGRRAGEYISPWSRWGRGSAGGERVWPSSWAPGPPRWWVLSCGGAGVSGGRGKTVRGPFRGQVGGDRSVCGTVADGSSHTLQGDPGKDGRPVSARSPAAGGGVRGPSEGRTGHNARLGPAGPTASDTLHSTY